MIPLPQILAELMIALGAALAGANAWALVRPRLRPEAPAPAKPQARARVISNIFIGALVAVWAFASLWVRNGALH